MNICSKYNVNDKLLKLEKALKSEKVKALGKGGENIEDDAIIPPMSTEQIVGVLRSRTMPPRCKEVTQQSIVYMSVVLSLTIHLYTCV